jgi:hypothetical protein
MTDDEKYVAWTTKLSNGYWVTVRVDEGAETTQRVSIIVPGFNDVELWSESLDWLIDTLVLAKEQVQGG